MDKEGMMEKLKGLNVSLCQMKVTPGRPDLNANYLIEEIYAAHERQVDIIVFPEMCTTGYIVGDVFEDDFFIDDVLRWNKKIVEATRVGITAIFGSVTVSLGQKGEDGRQRKHNTAIVAQNGQILIQRPKTLQPDYRFFNDDKHFYSLRKIAAGANLNDLLQPVLIQTGIGPIPIGVTVCEDMWHEDYGLNPIAVLVKNGAQLIINISASPWTWQKNRKRHQVIKDLLTECQVPFVYVNNTGSQNTGKNIIVFDGSSAIYNEKGEIILQIPAFDEKPFDFIFDVGYRALQPDFQNDTEELYNAMVCAAKSIVPPDAKVLVGLSGGIDSAVVCAHLVDVLGKERVIAVNMPMPSLNSQTTQDLARTVAENLGIEYQVIPIGEVVETICRATVVTKDTLAYENIQARVRKEILAAEAQKINGVFVCCSNKTEIAFGYGTLYGDIAGLYAPLGDLVKREVRQIADYLNRVRFKKEIIPQTCITQVPTAELALNQKDPFDYGGLERRGYHDEMIRAFTEFRKNPEWFLELYLKGRLEQELKLEAGTLNRLFPTVQEFVRDLRYWWTKFQQSFFKRVQCPPIPIFSRRAFGRDLEESLMVPHFTQRYRYLEEYLLSQNRKPRTVIFGGSLNPPGINHQLIVERLAEAFDSVIVVPCGIRADKSTTALVSPAHRKAMTTLTFQGMPKVEIDFSDIDHDDFTPTYLLQERYAQRFPDAEIWHAVGGDLVARGHDGNSEIQKSWKRGKEVWQNLKFAVISQPGLPVAVEDLPPSSRIVEIEIILGRSTTVRQMILQGKPIDTVVTPKVAEYIKEQKLYI